MKRFRFLMVGGAMAGFLLSACASPKQVIPEYKFPAPSPSSERTPPDDGRAGEIKRLEAVIRQLHEAEKKLEETQRKNEEALRRIEEASRKTEGSVERIERAQEKIEAVGSKQGL